MERFEDINRLDVTADMPRYLTGRMDASERAAFEVLLNADTDARAEADSMRGFVETVDTLMGSDRREYALSADRMEALCRAADTIQPMTRRTRVMRTVARAGAIAAALIVGAFVGLYSGQERYRVNTGLERLPGLEQTALAPVLKDPSFLYVYPPAYGLNQDDDWRLADRPTLSEAEGGVTRPFAQNAMNNEEPLPYYYGLDGPRPYYPYDQLSWGYI